MQRERFERNHNGQAMACRHRWCRVLARVAGLPGVGGRLAALHGGAGLFAAPSLGVAVEADALAPLRVYVDLGLPVGVYGDAEAEQVFHRARLELHALCPAVAAR